MHYFIPTLCLPDDWAAPSSLEDKFGGLPNGLPAHLWPVCAGCGAPQSFSAQFTHDPARLDLGRPGRRLFLFQCESLESVGECETWEAFSGANAALIVEPEDLTAGETAAPTTGLALTPEMHVARWEAADDGVPLSRVSAYFSDAGLSSLSDEEWDALPTGTKLGGVPAWIQGAEEVDPLHWRFVGQLDSRYCFEEDGALRYTDGANYGGGTAYVFVARDGGTSTPRACVFWQC